MKIRLPTERSSELVYRHHCTVKKGETQFDVSVHIQGDKMSQPVCFTGDSTNSEARHCIPDNWAVCIMIEVINAVSTTTPEHTCTTRIALHPRIGEPAVTQSLPESETNARGQLTSVRLHKTDRTVCVVSYVAWDACPPLHSGLKQFLYNGIIGNSNPEALR